MTADDNLAHWLVREFDKVYGRTGSNAGPEAAFQVVLTDVIPALLVDPVVVYASPEVIGPLPGRTFAWAISDLVPGDGGMVQVRATIDPAAEPESAVANQAQITTALLDPSRANNVASVSTTIAGPELGRLYLPLVVKDHP